MKDFMEMQVWWACWPFSFWYWTCGGEGSQKDNPVSWFGAQSHLESVAVFVSSDCWRWLGSRKKRQICARCRLYRKKLHENLTNTPDKLLKKLQTKIWFQGTLCSSFIGWKPKQEDIFLLPNTIALLVHLSCPIDGALCMCDKQLFPNYRTSS